MSDSDTGRVPPGAALDQLLDEIERFGREFERFMRSAASERKRGREDSEESLRNKANEQAQMIIARAKRLRAARDARPPQAPQEQIVHESRSPDGDGQVAAVRDGVSTRGAGSEPADSHPPAADARRPGQE